MKMNNAVLIELYLIVQAKMHEYMNKPQIWHM